MKKHYNKQTLKMLRKYADIAHERELVQALQKLHEQFADWRADKIDAFELNDRIHQFHQKTARDIWKMYTISDGEDMLVVRALQLGMLNEDEIGEKLIKQLGPMIECWQQ